MANRRVELFIVAVAALGMTSIVAQIILLREFISVFYGNELIIGVVLASWMVLTGAGSFAGRFSGPLLSRREVPPSALTAIGILPMLTVFLLRFLRNVVFTAGSMIGIVQALFTSFIVLAPYCLLSGFLFSFFAALLSERSDRRRISSVYSWESLGSAAGGLVFTVALVALLDTFHTLCALLIIDLGLAVAIARRERAPVAGAAAAALLILGCSGAVLINLDAVTRRFLFPGQEIVSFKDTPYGNLTITRQGDQLNFFENNLLMFSTNDVTSNEESVHYAMVQRSSPRRVLLISGGISGTTREILKYGVGRIDYVEVNPWIINIGRAYTQALNDDRISVITGDARMFVRSASGDYDAVLVNLPDPGTAQLNRYYTIEFFRDLKRIMRDSAVVSISLLPSADYQGSEARRVSSVLYATLRGIFAHVLIIPGDRNYFLASDGGLDIHVSRLIEQRGISTVYVNRYYLDDRQLEQRSKELTGGLDMAAGTNSDFRPVCYYRQLAYWLSYFGFDPGPWILAASGAAVLLLSRSSAIGAGIFAGGFAASSLELVLLLSFQVIYGSLYQMTGFVITAFMGGLACGSLLSQRVIRWQGIDRFILAQLAVAAVCFCLPPTLSLLRGMSTFLLPVNCAFTAIAFAVAVLIGMEFAIASVVRGGTPAEAASELYGLDLAGSALGAFLVSVYGIPLFGTMVVSTAAGGVSAAGALLCLAVRRRYITA